MSLKHLNPGGLYSNPAFSQAVVVPQATATVHVGGQNALDALGQIVGTGDIVAQTEQVFRNMEAVLSTAGTGLEHVIKWNVYVVSGQPIQAAFEVFQRVWGERSNPPSLTLLFVSGLAQPDYLIEIDAVAAIPTG